MVFIKNATASVRAVGAAVDTDGGLNNPAMAALAYECEVYFEEATVGQAFKDYAVELRQPAYLMCDLCDFSAFTPEAVVAITFEDDEEPRGQYVVVSGYGQLARAGNEADHGDVVLDREQYPVNS